MLLLVRLAFADPTYGPPPPPPEAGGVIAAPVRTDLVERVCEPAPEVPAPGEPPALRATGQVLNTTACVIGFFAGYGCEGAAPSEQVQEPVRPCGRVE